VSSSVDMRHQTHQSPTVHILVTDNIMAQQITVFKILNQYIYVQGITTRRGLSPSIWWERINGQKMFPPLQNQPFNYSSVLLKRAEFDVQTCPDEKRWIFYAELYIFHSSKLCLPNRWCSSTGWHDTWHDFLASYSRDGWISVIVFSPATSPAPEIWQEAM